MDFYKQLNYSLGNEDWLVEEQALRIAPKDHVLCVTASGDRPLHLLMTECAEIVSIDMNPIQNYLLELKINALARLDYEKYLQFLGCAPTPHRLDIFKQLKPHLSIAAANYWEQHKTNIRRGVLFQGRVERLSRVSAKFLNLFRHKKIKTLFAFTDLEAQREYLSHSWGSAGWQRLFEILLHPGFTRLLLVDPGLNSFTEYAASPGKYIYQKMQTYLDKHLARESTLLQLLMTGTLTIEAYVPYLTFEGYNKIRRDMGRLHYQTSNVIDYLEQHAERFDGFSLSDIASYMPQEVFERLLRNLCIAAKPGARFCLREFISKRQIPADLQNTLRRDSELEKKLESEECNFVYRFMVGEIQKYGIIPAYS